MDLDGNPIVKDASELSPRLSTRDRPPRWSALCRPPVRQASQEGDPRAHTTISRTTGRRDSGTRIGGDSLRSVFFGTPEWAVPSLEALIASDIEVAAVVTNPDRPAGRKLELHASPVKEAALAAGLEVLQPEKARDPDFQERLKAIGPDVAPVVAYGKILPTSVLEIPPYGFVNLHFSLLPQYRGAAPVQRSVIDGVGRPEPRRWF